MAEAVIVEAVRSPVGKRNGGLSGVHPAELSAQVLNGLAERAGIDPAIVDDVIWGCVMQAGEQALDIGRTALLTAGWPESVAGVTIDRQCGSSQQSIHFAAAGVVAGHYDAVVAGGVESMSRTPMGASLAGGGNPYPQGFKDRYKKTPNQGIGAEMIAEQWGFDRTAVDEFSLGSHEKAAAAQDSGAFDDQIVAWNFIPSGLVFVSSSMFQALGNTIPSLVSSLIRTALLVIPAYLMSRVNGFALHWIWYLSVAVVAIHATMNVVLLQREYRRKLTFAPAAAAPPVVAPTLAAE